MPIISSFFGIVILMYWREHGAPHFHARYGEHEAVIAIQTLEVLDGRLPARALAMVLEWAFAHRSELMTNWRLCEEMNRPEPINPLE